MKASLIEFSMACKMFCGSHRSGVDAGWGPCIMRRNLTRPGVWVQVCSSPRMQWEMGTRGWWESIGRRSIKGHAVGVTYAVPSSASVNAISQKVHPSSAYFVKGFFFHLGVLMLKEIKHISQLNFFVRPWACFSAGVIDLSKANMAPFVPCL